MTTLRHLLFGLIALIIAPIIIFSKKEQQSSVKMIFTRSQVVTEAEKTHKNIKAVPHEQHPVEKVKSKQASVLANNLDLPENSIENITIHNMIEPKMLGYKKFGTHYPSDFSISVDGKKILSSEDKKIIKKDEKIKIKATDNTINIRYDYKFGSHKEGANVVTFKISPTVRNLNLSFDWKDENRIVLDHAEAIAKIPVERKKDSEQ